MNAVKRIVLPLVLATFVAVPVARADSPRKNQLQGIPVGGTSADGNNFSGTMDVLGFVNDNGLKAIALLTGTIKPATGAAQQVNNIVLVPVSNAATAPTGFGGFVTEPSGTRDLTTNAPSAQQTTCPILNLVLGPLDLNLLGLTVHLNQVVLDITAVPGAGNLLGNLLCGVANLLNGTGTGALGGSLTNVLAQLLNNLATALAGL